MGISNVRRIQHSDECAACQKKDEEIATLKAQLAKAVQRDSWAYDLRSFNDGKKHVKLS